MDVRDGKPGPRTRRNLRGSSAHDQALRFARRVQRPGADCAVGVGRVDECPVPTLDDFADVLADRGLVLPVLPVDVRQRDDVLMLVDTVLALAEGRN